MNYYNENHVYAAQWLRNLIEAGHIASGEVDERDIRDVQPGDLTGYRQCHFFAGIGGWSYALRLAGWPDDRRVWTGSCPCQPFSAAGKRKGADDERHLWPEFNRLIAECAPAVVFGEQVAGKDGLTWLNAVRADLEAIGYAVGAADLCAAGVGSPQIRQRLYWVADAQGDGRGQGCSDGRGIVPGVDAAPERLRPADGGDALRFECAESVGLLWRENDEDIGRRECASGLGSSVSRMVDAGCEFDEFGRGAGHLESASSQVEGQAQQRQRCGNAAIDFGAVSRMANSNGWHAGAERQQRSGQHGQFEEDGGAGFWEESEWLYCADGKFRPVESGTFPLAHGVPKRMGKLRAYGNAIVPQIAAEFIAAFDES